MSIDTGKAIIDLFNEKNSVILVDIYADGELLMRDIDNIHKAIEHFNVDIPVDTICVKSGKNYLSDEAFDYSLKHNCIHNKVIYVIKHMVDIHFPSQAQKTFFKDHLVDFCASVDDAYRLLKNTPH